MRQSNTMGPVFERWQLVGNTIGEVKPHSSSFRVAHGNWVTCPHSQNKWYWLLCPLVGQELLGQTLGLKLSKACIHAIQTTATAVCNTGWKVLYTFEQSTVVVKLPILNTSSEISILVNSGLSHSQHVTQFSYISSGEEIHSMKHSGQLLHCYHSNTVSSFLPYLLTLLKLLCFFD